MTRIGGVLTGLILLATGCAPEAPSSPVQPQGLFMPTLADPTDAYPSALIEGSLVERDPCLFLEAEGGSTFLIIWPHGWDVSPVPGGGNAVVDENGRVAHRIGDEVEVGGGFVSESRDSVAFPQELIGRPIPDACKADGYWLASP